MPKPSDFFECKKCGECCKGYGGAFVSDREIERISRHLGIDPERFLADYCDWSGKRPIIKTAESGCCIFWNKVCTIHEVKPRMCKIWPFIESILVDRSNWAIIKSMCPGIHDNGNMDDLAECVRMVLAEYDTAIKDTCPLPVSVSGEKEE
ncbi:MAG: YkgJ family cysteine cluster protein [Desulfobacterales bacterium]|nr:YkgJ family cysteine cluster protein [Desulfobacterales bacterium]